MVMYMFQRYSLNSSHPLLLPLVHKSILYASMSASLFLPCKNVYQYHFSRFHVLCLVTQSCLFVAPWTTACLAPQSIGIHHEYWSGLPRPSPCYLPNPGIKPRSPTLQANSLPAELPGKPLDSIYMH